MKTVIQKENSKRVCQISQKLKIIDENDEEDEE